MMCSGRAFLACSFLLLLLFGAGCSQPDHEGAIRKRFEQGVQHLCKNEIDPCLDLVDPLYVRAQGTEAVKVRLKIVAGLFKVGNITETDVKIDEIVVAADKKTAQVKFSFKDKQGKPPEPIKWVFSDGKWYWTF